MVPGGHLSVILVVIIGFRQWGVRKGQGMAPNGPRYYIFIKNFWLWSPLETPEWVRDPGKRLKSIVEMVWGPFLVSLGHLGGSTGLRSQQFCIGFTARAAFLAIF